MNEKQEALTKALQTAQLLLSDLRETDPIAIWHSRGEDECLTDVVIRIAEQLEWVLESEVR